MTESYSYTTEDDIVAEDAPTVQWVDGLLDEAERSGTFYQLSLDLDNAPTLDTAAVQTLVTQAEAPVEAPPTAPTREEIREKIFARLRRPDGTPYAAGYTVGPAARKAMYEGEDTRAGRWRGGEARQDSDFRTTLYEDREGIEDRAATAEDDGLLYDEDGELVDGRWGWVMDDATGYLLLFDPARADWFDPEGRPYPKQSWDNAYDLWRRGYRVQQTHHSTPVAGLPVTGAGEIRVERGVVKEITDESGHYRPDSAQQSEAIQALMAQGLSLEQARIRLTGRTMGDRPTDKAAWLDEAARTNPDFPTGDVSLRADQFTQTGGDEYQIRMKQALNEQIRDRGERPGTQTTEGYGRVVEPSNYDDFSGSDSDSESEEDDEPMVDEYGRRLVMVPDVERGPGYFKSVLAEDVGDGGDGADSADDSVSEDEDEPIRDDLGRRLVRVPDPERGPGYFRMVPEDEAGTDPSDSSADSSSDSSADSSGEGDAEGDSSPEETTADFVSGARDYLAEVGRSQFAQWFRTLPAEHQELLVQDAQIAAAWQAENAAPPAWTPADSDQAAAATLNGQIVKDLDDRETVPFTVAGFALVVGTGHDPRLEQFAATAADRAAGTLTVRKAGLGRGNGSLTFTGVPPAKQEVVRSAVRRFSDKEVRFA